jgi:hypothetical protein
MSVAPRHHQRPRTPPRHDRAPPRARGSLVFDSGALFAPRAHFGAAAAPGGRVFVLGGEAAGGGLADVWRWDRSGGSKWECLTEAAPPAPPSLPY